MMWKRYRENKTLFIAFGLTIILGLSSALIPVRAASGNEYYVAQNGSDSNPGTLERPWRTIQKAASTLSAGDTVVVQAGNYWERVQVTRSGSSGSSITYQAEGRVVTQGFTVRADYITIQGFEVENTADSTVEGHGIWMEGSNCLVEDNYINSATWGGIAVHGNNCVVKNNRTYRNGNHGLEIHGRNNLIENNEIERTIQYHPSMNYPPSWVDADGVIFFGSGHVFRGNYIHGITYDDPENVNPHSDAFQTWSDGYHEAASDILFENNIIEVLTYQAAAERGHAFMLHDATNITIRNNVIMTHGGINAGYGTSNLKILNNIFVNDLSFHEFWPKGIELAGVPNATVKNNIFYNQAEDTIISTGTTSGHDIDYNMAYRSDGRSSECYEINFSCAYPDHHYWDVNPLFVNPGALDFRLQQNSPAIDLGAALSQVPHDFDGNVRPQGAGHDIGPFEFLGSIPATTFGDVPTNHWAYDYIETLYDQGYISGCSTDPLMYCPENVMTRAESAVFIERGLKGGGFLPDDPDEIIFADVALNDWFAKWVTTLWHDGYTAGCETDPLTYCPMNENTRAEGTVFFLRMLHGVDYVPPDPQGLFSDASVDMWYTRWMEAAYQAGLIPACEDAPDLRICPNDLLTRAMGAYMMYQAKGLE